MKKILVISILYFSITSLSAQLRMQDLSGNWKLRSYTKNGVAQNINDTYFKYYESDIGDPMLDQIFTKAGKERCYATCMIMINDSKVYHDYLMSSIEEDPSCGFWIPGEFTYELKNGILKIWDKESVLELQRK